MPGITLPGGFPEDGSSEQRDFTANETTLSGDIGPAGWGDNALHVIIGSDNAVIDGFTVFGGNAAGLSGGGKWNHGVSPTVRNGRFVQNQAGAYGGGMFNDGASPLIESCEFWLNASADNGGGMANYNEASPTVRHTLFRENMALAWDGSGGAIIDMGAFER